MLGGVSVKSHSWDGERAVLFALPRKDARAAREALLRAARDAVAGSDACAAFGPTVADGLRAHDSYVEAQEIMRLGMPAAGEVLDAMDFLGRRILDAVPDPGFLDSYVESTLGEVLTGTGSMARPCWRPCCAGSIRGATRRRRPSP